MNYLLTIFLATQAAMVLGQTSVDFGRLTHSWTQGKIDTNDKVIQADLSMGGWYHLNINTDYTAKFGDPFTCGFGSERHGKWALNKKDTTVTFSFAKRVGYLNTPGSADIKETEIYKIKKLTADELILKKMGQDTTLPFIRTDKIKN